MPPHPPLEVDDALMAPTVVLLLTLLAESIQRVIDCGAICMVAGSLGSRRLRSRGSIAGCNMPGALRSHVRLTMHEALHRGPRQTTQSLLTAGV